MEQSQGLERDLGSLAEVVDLAFERTGATSARRLATYAKEHNHVITATTLNAIRAGTYPAKPRPRTLEALAYLSGRSLNEVRKAADLPVRIRRSFADQLPPDVDELRPESREALLSMARVMLDMQRRSSEGGNT